jgi:uncharacterized protein
MITKRLIKTIRSQFALDWTGIYGAPHWSRVRENGLRIAEATGANITVVELFAFLHDSKRLNDGRDPKHGLRATEFARAIAGKEFDIEQHELELLAEACTGHSDGYVEGDITVLTCWDADRLDLGRVGIQPNPQYLCTEVAKQAEILEWAYRRSQLTDSFGVKNETIKNHYS